MRKWIKQYIRSILMELLDEPNFKPKFKEIKTYRVIQSKSPYSIIGNVEVTSFAFVVDYVDPRDSSAISKRHAFKSLGELRDCLYHFNSEYDHYNGVTFVIEYNHCMGSQRSSDIIVNSLNHAVYESSQLNKIIKPLVSWMDKHPELLI